MVDMQTVSEGFKKIIERDMVGLNWRREIKIWKKVELNDLLEELIDYRGKTPIKSTYGIPVLSAKVVCNGTIKKPITQRISNDYYKEWMRKGYPQIGDIVLTTEGPLGEVAELDHSDYALGQRIVCLRGREGVLDNRFLKFFLMSAIGQQELLSRATGTTVAGISQKALRKILVPLPSLSEQKAIAEVLGALDDKIELNRQMNQTLEAMAQALFKDWFVDFGPTRTKMAGRPAYLPQDIWDLFPDKLDDEGKPKGWKMTSVIESAEFINGAAYKSTHFSESFDSLPIIKIVELKNGVGQTTQYTNVNLGEKFRINCGDVLFSWSGSPDTSIGIFIWTGGMAWLNQHIFKVITKSKEERCFNYWLMKHLNPFFIEIARDKQTTGLGHVTRANIEGVLYVKPNHDIIMLFYQLAGLIMDKIQNSMSERCKLKKLCNYLLSILIYNKKSIK